MRPPATGLVDRAAIHADLERARVEFHRLLAAAGPDNWRRPTDGTRWSNEQLLFHMVFGYTVVRRLHVLVRVVGLLPDRVAPASRGCSTRPRYRSIGSTTTAPARPRPSTTAAGWVPNSTASSRRCSGVSTANPTETYTVACTSSSVRSVLPRLDDPGERLPLSRAAFRSPRAPAHSHRSGLSCADSYSPVVHLPPVSTCINIDACRIASCRC